MADKKIRRQDPPPLRLRAGGLWCRRAGLRANGGCVFQFVLRASLSCGTGGDVNAKKNIERTEHGGGKNYQFQKSLKNLPKCRKNLNAGKEIFV